MDITQRWDIALKLDGSEKEIDTAILENLSTLKTKFRKIWSEHKCETKGCGEILVCDGGMTPHRMVCAARYSGVRTYKETNIKTVVGCGKKPGTNSPFCKEHQNGDQGPVVLAENVSKETRENLRKDQPSSFPQDNVFFIKSLIKYNKSNDTYLVRWANASEKSDSWENEEIIPRFIINWYKEDLDRLGKEIPKPKIKWTKAGGPGEKFYFLSWGNSGTWVNTEELQESLFDLESQAFIPESSCNTRKEKDKRSRRHTVGLHIVAWPCGIIPDFSELFGSESITQVWALLCDFFGDMEPDKQKQLKAFVYDDMCHLKPFSEKDSQKSQSEIAEFFATLKKAVDKLHFRGHKGAYCHKECDPWKLRELDEVNTVVCEQLFSWVNRFKACRNMNEARFFLYFLALIDMRNNDREKKLRKLLHPKSIARFSKVTHVLESKNYDEALLKKNTSITEDTSLDTDIVMISQSSDDLGKELNSNKSDSHLKLATSEKSLKCISCDKTYKLKASMIKHMKTNHNVDSKENLQCKICEKTFTTLRKLTRHQKESKCKDKIIQYD